MRALLAVVLLCPVVALADVPAVSSSPSMTSPPVSNLDTVRLFNTVEVFHLEPNDIRAEVGFESGIPQSQPTLAVRAQIGLTRHFQLDLAEDITEHRGNLQPSATPIGVRYTIGSQEDDILFNPAIEAKVTPRLNAPSRAGLRLLLSEEVMPHLVVAANGYIEQNLERDTAVGVDGTVGATGGVSYSVLSGHLHLGAEGQLGGAEYGGVWYQPVIAAGPNAVASLGPVALTLSGLFNLAPSKVAFEPMATLGCTF